MKTLLCKLSLVSSLNECNCVAKYAMWSAYWKDSLSSLVMQVPSLPCHSLYMFVWYSNFRMDEWFPRRVMHYHHLYLNSLRNIWSIHILVS